MNFTIDVKKLFERSKSDRIEFKKMIEDCYFFKNKMLLTKFHKMKFNWI